MKVYTVHEIYHEQDTDFGHVYDSDIIVGVFDSEVKAVNCICEKIKSDHERIDKTCAIDGEHTRKYPVNVDRITECGLVDSWESVNGAEFILQSYRYVSYELQ